MPTQRSLCRVDITRRGCRSACRARGSSLRSRSTSIVAPAARRAWRPATALNGLDDGESWRDGRPAHGGTPALPVLQHVTSACHHCLDPACMEGCPVNAYEKDPRNGHRQASRRPVHRLPVLHAQVSVRRPKVQQARESCASATCAAIGWPSGEAPGLRAGVPDTRRSGSRSSIEQEVIEAARPTDSCRGARARLHAADHGLRTSSALPRQSVAGRPLRGDAGAQPHCRSCSCWC